MTVENLPRRQFLRGKFLTSLHSENEQKQGFDGIRPPWAVENSFLWGLVLRVAIVFQSVKPIFW